MENKPKNYADAGVDLTEATEFTEDLKELLPKTFRKGCVPLPGGFAGLFDLKKEGLEDSLLVMATDGVGTKVLLGIEWGQVRGLGTDLVAMNVNDIITLGAQPLCFLDYLAYAKLPSGMLQEIVAGVAQGCLQAGAALIGGETAQMSGVYKPGDFDLAGFCLGAVARDKLINGSAVVAGDVVMALPSSGIHSNGFSLVRSILAPLESSEVQEKRAAILKPTRIYTKEVSAVCAKVDVHAMAHITGGGLVENLSRVIPDGLFAKLRRDSWQVPEIFSWLQSKGDVDAAEMFRVFNMGVGYVFVVPAAQEALMRDILGVEVWTLGEIEATAAAAGMKAQLV